MGAIGFQNLYGFIIITEPKNHNGVALCKGDKGIHKYDGYTGFGQRFEQFGQAAGFVHDFGGYNFIDIRQYFFSEEKQTMIPTKKGITFSPKQFEVFLGELKKQELI